jgi:chromosome partitioning protein
MKRIAFVAQKGGSGKSTLAACLAVAARETGERVFLIDLDPLQALTYWAKARTGSDIPVVATPAHKLEKVLTKLEALGITLAIIDTPGGESEAFDAALKAAQFCVVPARPNVFDLLASGTTLQKLKARKRDYAFVLNQCPTSQQSARTEEGVDTLEAMGGLMTPLVTSRVDYQEAARRGLGVTEVNPSGAAAAEIRGLWASLSRRLAKGIGKEGAGKAKNLAA